MSTVRHTRRCRMSAADWMSGSVVDDMRAEARSARNTDDRHEHGPSCRCRDCLLDVYVPGDDRGTALVALLLAGCVAGALLALFVLAGQHVMCSVHQDPIGQPTISYCDGYAEGAR